MSKNIISLDTQAKSIANEIDRLSTMNPKELKDFQDKYHVTVFFKSENTLDSRPGRVDPSVFYSRLQQYARFMFVPLDDDGTKSILPGGQYRIANEKKSMEGSFRNDQSIIIAQMWKYRVIPQLFNRKLPVVIPNCDYFDKMYKENQVPLSDQATQWFDAVDVAVEANRIIANKKDIKEEGRDERNK